MATDGLYYFALHAYITVTEILEPSMSTDHVSFQTTIATENVSTEVSSLTNQSLKTSLNFKTLILSVLIILLYSDDCKL